MGHCVCVVVGVVDLLIVVCQTSVGVGGWDWDSDGGGEKTGESEPDEGVGEDGPLCGLGCRSCDALGGGSLGSMYGC